MANQVNRVPLNEVPEEWAFHPTIGPFIRSLLEVIYQERERSGGDNDNITDIQIQESYPWQKATDTTEETLADNLSFGLGLNGDFESVKHKRVVSSNYVTIGNEYLILSRNVTVTLNETPQENESVWITWDKGFTLKSNKQIVSPQGISKEIRFNKPYGGRWIDYIVELDQWRLR